MSSLLFTSAQSGQFYERQEHDQQSVTANSPSLEKNMSASEADIFYSKLGELVVTDYRSRLIIF